MGYLLLEGGAEFGGAMREPDLRAIELAGGFEAPIRIIPTAAAPDKNHLRAGGNGVRWFQGLGARDVESIPLIDKNSANDPEIVETLRAAKLIYLLGGFTHYLSQTLQGSKAWEAALEAYQNGAVIAGSSAGAMVLCEHYYDPGSGKIVQGLNLVPNACVLPHHNSFGKNWASKLKAILPGVRLLGIDEYTGLLTKGAEWQVLGGGVVTLYRNDQIEKYENGQSFTLNA
ncbi:MAG: Type 1 glutamine amidotransferase-like domain-containing protein [Anaerolineales bacterium]|uniref:Type 1 glutamine amidotransferase-like domain-containing protein n=1 Tax=Candidatus Desulfolinea nitratireducens TaxID=2841698 RepID=A0A8J6TE53_9CHLR|nr:Type 1 glutamine amidotransferase-like domain-containing protein [Candidatus Desulfolinea nitratireducens]MBL6960464.1 Type 1 glutamine amidotransferase-like domain-containing protein [Anaerolineales bacterium]